MPKFITPCDSQAQPSKGTRVERAEARAPTWGVPLGKQGRCEPLEDDPCPLGLPSPQWVSGTQKRLRISQWPFAAPGLAGTHVTPGPLPIPAWKTLKPERFENSAGVLPPQMKPAAQPDSERASASRVGTEGAWDKVYLYFHAALQLTCPVWPGQDHSTQGMAPGSPLTLSPPLQPVPTLPDLFHLEKYFCFDLATLPSSLIRAPPPHQVTLGGPSPTWVSEASGNVPGPHHSSDGV